MDNSTNMTDGWIERTVKNNPITLLESGNYRTCPVRLSFAHVFERAKPVEAGQEGKFGSNLIFPLCADLAILKAAAAEVAKEKWPNPGKLRSPFKEQSDMLKYDGYTEGGIYLSCNTDRKPPVVDVKGQVVTDEDRVYPGVWAICTIRPFAYDAKVNKGVAFGLQSVMLIADDKNLGGGGEDVSKAFAGVNIEAGDVDTSALFALFA